MLRIYDLVLLKLLHKLIDEVIRGKVRSCLHFSHIYGILLSECRKSEVLYLLDSILAEVIHSSYLVDVVSKNGNLLLNVGPKSDGSIAEQDVHILKEMGAWLKLNGEAIYNSKPWRYCAEGPTKEAEGHFQEVNNQYTSKDFRFTAGNGAIYATCLSYPEDGELLITSLCLPGGSGKKFEGILTNVSILGTDAPVTYELTKEGLKVHGPAKFTDYPVVLKIMTN